MYMYMYIYMIYIYIYIYTTNLLLKVLPFLDYQVNKC